MVNQINTVKTALVVLFLLFLLFFCVKMAILVTFCLAYSQTLLRHLRASSTLCGRSLVTPGARLRALPLALRQCSRSVAGSGADGESPSEQVARADARTAARFCRMLQLRRNHEEVTGPWS